MLHHRSGLMLLLLLAFAAWTPAASVVDLTVQDGPLALAGRLALPTATGPRPAVLVVHEWWGRNAYAERRARELAELGYVALAADCYGEAASDDFQVAVRRSAPFYADPGLFARRLAPALAALRARPEVDARRVAAIGFCFGGSAVLQLARDGQDLRGVVAFHPGLRSAAPAAAGRIRAAILVEHGGADPFVPPAEVQAFVAEMLQAGARWSLRSHAGAVHAFTNPDAGRGVANVPAEVPFAQAVRYDAAAEAAAMAGMRVFLADVLR